MLNEPGIHACIRFDILGLSRLGAFAGTVPMDLPVLPPRNIFFRAEGSKYATRLMLWQMIPRLPADWRGTDAG